MTTCSIASRAEEARERDEQRGGEATPKMRGQNKEGVAEPAALAFPSKIQGLVLNCWQCNLRHHQI